MVELEAWYDAEHDGPTIIRTPDELDAVLDAVTGWDGRILVDLYVADNRARATFNVGVNARTRCGALYYADDHGEWFSMATTESDQAPVERILYYYMNSDTEYPGDCEIPLDVVRRAAHEYMATGGERPTALTWQPAPAWW